MNRISLRLRLLVAWAVFIAVTLQVADIGLRVLFKRSITERTASELAADLRQLRRGMDVAPSGAVTILRAPTDPQFDIVFGGRYWQIDEGAAALLRSPSLKDATLELPKNFEPGEKLQKFSLIGPEDQNLFGVVRTHTLNASSNGPPRVLTIMTAVDAAEIQEDTDKFAADLFKSLAGLALLLLSGAIIHVTIGLRPLETLRAKVAEVRAGRARHIDGDYPEEVMPLVSETNALLEGQEIALQAARARAGDLAHGLNTPLAVMAAKSRGLKRKGEIEVANEIDLQIEAMRRHIERELARARARGPSRVGITPIDASLLTRNLITALDSLPRDVPIDWIDEMPRELALAVDGDDFNNIAGNLLENAHKWAKSRVCISARREARGAEFIVEDDGPGVPEDQIDRVVQRGERADTSVGGFGLGLAIVNDLVELYGGTLQLSRSPLGGLRATVWMPK